MILSGFAISNTMDSLFRVNDLYSDIIRNIAITVLLIQTGIELDLSVLRRMSWLVMRICFLPMISEILVVSIASCFMLNLPIVWSLMLGFIVSAACAAIIVPKMIELKR